MAKLSHNITSLYLIQAAGYLIPVVMYPYLVRVIGPDKFGSIIFAQSVTQYFILLTDFGFRYTATREVALHANDKEYIASLYASTTFLRWGFLIISMAVLFLLAFLVTPIGLAPLLFILTFGEVVGNVLLPHYLFQGLEKFSLYAGLVVIGRFASAVLILCTVTDSGDYLKVPLWYSLGQIMAGIAAVCGIRFIWKIKLHLPKYSIVRKTFHDGLKIFGAAAGVGAYTNGITVLLGLFASPAAVGFYGGAEKIVRAVQKLFAPLSQSIFPVIAKKSKQAADEAHKNIRTVGLVLGTAAFLCSLILFIFAKQIVLVFLGEQFSESAIVLKIVSPIPFFAGVSIIFTNFYLLAFGHFDRWFKIIITASLISLIAGILFIAILRWEYTGAALTALLAEILVAVISGIFYFKHFVVKRYSVK